LVGAAGIFGFSKVQWQHLAEGLLKKDWSNLVFVSSYF
jgi:hypothetical protein